ncbi:MAG: hypothetical protein OEY88_02900 [Candidatus Bathyarchaeota archaeon]|nr:hypothetical protein [Candidatus Bathyarchaeota archaeon]
MPPDLYCDVNCDGGVRVDDVLRVALAFGSNEGDPDWDPACDVTEDGKVRVDDILEVSGHFGDTESPSYPIAYSTTLEFTVPDDGGEEVWYYVLARVYVPEDLSNETFYFVASASANDGVQDVMLDETSNPGSGSPVNIDLGSLGKGYHLLEFVFVEVADAGSLSFHVATAAEEYAWLARFRIYIPDYSDTEYEYTLTPNTWCTMKDDYFLIGYADDYIDDVCVDGTVWQDWEWDCAPYDTIYAWEDGFCYPLGNLENNIGGNAYDMSFKFSEIEESGLLDFQHGSWTHQRDRIGRPRFYAISDVNLEQTHYNAQITEKKLYGGSQWYMEAGSSKRYITTVQEFVWIEDRGPAGQWGARLRLETGIGWLPLTTEEFADFGIMLNLTYLDSAGYNAFRKIDLYDSHVDVYTPESLNIVGIEFVGDGQSKVSEELLGWRIVEGIGVGLIAYAATGPFGAVAGIIAGQSIDAVFEYALDQEEEDAHDQGGTPTHHTFGYHPIWWVTGWIYGPLIPVENVGESNSHLMFIRLNPMAQKHCGAVKLVFHGQIRFDNGYWDSASFETTIIVPWFLP